MRQECTTWRVGAVAPTARSTASASDRLLNDWQVPRSRAQRQWRAPVSLRRCR